MIAFFFFFEALRAAHARRRTCVRACVRAAWPKLLLLRRDASAQSTGVLVRTSSAGHLGRRDERASERASRHGGRNHIVVWDVGLMEWSSIKLAAPLHARPTPSGIAKSMYAPAFILVPSLRTDKRPPHLPPDCLGSVCQE
ncbi:hypothetical protein IWZ03DRAFT_44008 [Phyllosticta citriasiana]|uniref:Secreted protein n=1 Tax=Phyllosticta citriasiana TaxID=595635 RepID=A0ABR1KE33_9PEZI